MIIDFNKTAGGGVTPEQVEQEIQSALTPYWESGETKDYVDEAVSGLATEQYVQDALSGIDLSNYYTSAQTDTAIANAVSGLATEQYVQDALSGVDLTNYWTSAETEEAISAATSGKADAANVTANATMKFPLWNGQGVITGIVGNAYDMNININGKNNSILRNIIGNIGPIYAPAAAGTSGDILVSTGNGAPVWSSVTMPDMAAYTPTSGFSTINGSAITNGGNLVIQGGGGSNFIIPAITTDEEYEAISGSIKSGDLIQVWDVDINGDEETEYGLFQASNVHEGVIDWERRDSYDSLLWADKDYPWLTDNEVHPVDFGSGSFLISLAEGGYNGIGFDGEGKAVITHIVPEEDEQTGEITGMTMEDRDILGELDTLDEVVSRALVDLNEKKVESEDVKHIVKLTQADYDQLVLDDEVDPETFYIIVNNSL